MPSRFKSKKGEQEFSKYQQYKELINILIVILVGILICNCLIKYVVQGAVISGSSMWPTYEDSDYVIVDKIMWKLDSKYSIKRFDIIVCESDYNNRELLIKRVIGLPGEKVTILPNGEVYINDSQIEDVWAYYSKDTNFLAIEITRELGEDEYFVCGDNRNGSLDSRYDVVGNIKEKDVIGKVIEIQKNREE